MKKLLAIFLLVSTPSFAQTVPLPACPLGWTIGAATDVQQPDTTIQRSFTCSVNEPVAQYKAALSSLQNQSTTASKQSSALSAQVTAMQAIAASATQSAQPVR